MRIDPMMPSTSQVGVVSIVSVTGSHSQIAIWRSIAGWRSCRLVEWMLFQSSPSLVMNIAFPAIDLVPSRTSATNPAARIQRPVKRKRKRIMTDNSLWQPHWAGLRLLPRDHRYNWRGAHRPRQIEAWNGEPVREPARTIGGDAPAASEPCNAPR